MEKNVIPQGERQNCLFIVAYQRFNQGCKSKKLLLQTTVWLKFSLPHSTQFPLHFTKLIFPEFFFINEPKSNALKGWFCRDADFVLGVMMTLHELH